MAACEMEGAAIAQVCHQFDVPFAVIRLYRITPTMTRQYLDSYIVAGLPLALMVMLLEQLNLAQ